MSEKTFTPGPWHVSTKSAGFEDGWTICIMGDEEDLRIRNESPELLGDLEKDAELIAAAPELLEAAQEALALGSKVYHNANAHEAAKDWGEVRRLLVAAISKATGAA